MTDLRGWNPVSLADDDDEEEGDDELAREHRAQRLDLRARLGGSAHVRSPRRGARALDARRDAEQGVDLLAREPVDSEEVLRKLQV